MINYMLGLGKVGEGLEGGNMEKGEVFTQDRCGEVGVCLMYLRGLISTARDILWWASILPTMIS